METVERHVVLPVDGDEAWRLVTDPDELATWLGTDVDLAPAPGAAGEVTDPDGTVRHVLVESVEEGRSISWYWWTDDDVVSRVDLQLTPDGAGTRLRVAERPTLRSANARATASTRSGAWSYRLFALEVRCLAASTAVLVRS